MSNNYSPEATPNSEQKDNIYFANKEAKDTAAILLDKAQTFYKQFSRNDFIEKIKASWRAYHGFYNTSYASGHQISFSGEQGELVQFPVNHYRNIAQHIHVMVTSNRPSMEARAINTDYKSLAQTYLANGILDYYMREKKLEDAIKKAVELAIVMGAGYIKMEWDATSGNIYDINDESGTPIYEGDAKFSNLSPLDVVVDGTKESWNNDWVLTRSFKNRFDMIAKYPELKDKIMAIPKKSFADSFNIVMFSNDDTDDIPIYEFYHKSTEAVQGGRYMLFSDSNCVYLDSKLPYHDIPVYRIVPGEFLGTPYGYSPMFDIMPLQEALNSLFSTILTNQNAFGVQNLFVPRGADVSLNALTGGLNIIEGNIKPESLNLTNTPPEIFKFLEMIVQTAETLSGVNSVARGNPEASLKSGTALALVQSMALQFISGLQQSYIRLIEDVGTGLLDILKDYATTPTVVAIVGRNNRPLLKEFTGDQIDKVSRVVVDVGNPLARTISGRVQIAEQLLQMQAIKNPTQYFQVLNTGRLDTMFEGETAELLLIKSENEGMLDGKPAIITILDKHSMHIEEHKAVLSDPDMRRDQELVKLVVDHIQEHINALKTVDPELLQLIGEQPMGMPQGGPPPQGQPPGQPVDQVLAQQQMNDANGQVQSISGEATPPQPAQVPAAALANPQLQQDQMGNVKG